MTTQAKMESQYFLREDGDTMFVVIKNGQDFGYRIQPVEGGVRLTKAYSPRSYIKPTYKKVRDFVSKEMALQFIVKRHNKACEYMRDWTVIEIPAAI